MQVYPQRMDTFQYIVCSVYFPEYVDSIAIG